jgi:hypothetical protein
MMDVDRRHPHALQEVAAEDLHVPGQHQQVGLARQQLQHRRLGLGLTALGHRHVVVGNAGGLGLATQVLVV